MNHELIEKLAKRLEKLPDSYHYDEFGNLRKISWYDRHAPESLRPLGWHPPELRFDQGVWHDEYCGTACCIAGHLAMLQNEPHTDLPPQPYFTWIEYVSEALDISLKQAECLVDSEPLQHSDRPPTAKEAAQAVRNLSRYPDQPDRDPWAWVACNDYRMGDYLEEVMP